MTMANDHISDPTIRINTYDSVLNERHLEAYRAANRRRYNPVNERKANTGVLIAGCLATTVAALACPAILVWPAKYTAIKAADRLFMWMFPMTPKKAGREDVDKFSLNAAALIPFAQVFPRLQDVLVKHRGLYEVAKL